MRETTERVGFLVIRAWVEAHDGTVRARITGRLDLLNSQETFAVVAGVDSAAEVVRDWLEELERGVSAGSVTEA
jgi:hypothetical protein